MRIGIAIFLGLGSFLVMMFVGETAGIPAAAAALAVYFFVSQFFLSFGHPGAHRKDWRIMLALNACLLISLTIMVAVEKWDIVLRQAIAFPLSMCAGTFAGAVAASVIAKRTVARP